MRICKIQLSVYREGKYQKESNFKPRINDLLLARFNPWVQSFNLGQDKLLGQKIGFNLSYMFVSSRQSKGGVSVKLPFEALQNKENLSASDATPDPLVSSGFVREATELRGYPTDERK